MSSLLSHLKLWKCPGSCCFPGSCLDLWPSSNSGLGQCSWPCRYQRQLGHIWSWLSPGAILIFNRCTELALAEALRSTSSIPHLGSYEEPGKLSVAPHLGSRVELALMAGVWISWPGDCEWGRSSTGPHLSIVGELAPKEREQVSQPLISRALAFGRAS